MIVVYHDTSAVYTLCVPHTPEVCTCRLQAVGDGACCLYFFTDMYFVFCVLARSP